LILESVGHITHSIRGGDAPKSLPAADAIADIGNFKAKELVFDARYADEYAQRINDATGIAHVVVAPSPAQLSPAMKELESAVYDGRFHYDGHPVLTWAMGNVLSRETPAVTPAKKLGWAFDPFTT
jgi:phage terminase large subunit-like protein